MSKMTTEQYHEYLKTPKWRSIAQRRREIDGGKCQMCGREGSQADPLQCHHLDYHHIGEEEQGDFIYTRLVTLCASCHKAVHRMMNRRTNAQGRRGWKDQLSYANHVLETDDHKIN